MAEELSNREKNLIAMGAVDKLYGIAVEIKTAEREMLKVFALGLETRMEALATMQAKVRQLLGSDEIRMGH